MILVSRADQESREAQLGHGTNRDEDEKEWVVMGLDVRHSSKSSGSIGMSVSQWLREDKAKVWTRVIEGLAHRGTVVTSMRKTRGSRPETMVQVHVRHERRPCDSDLSHVESRLAVATCALSMSYQWIKRYASPSSIALVSIIESTASHHHSLPQVLHFNASLARLRAPSRVLFPATSGSDMREKHSRIRQLTSYKPRGMHEDTTINSS